MSRLSQFAVSKRSVTLLLAGALFVAGLLAWGNLKQELLPDIEFPVITVIAPLPGAGAADVADQVTKPIELAIAGVPRLEALQSTSANSLALVVAQFSFGSDVKEIRAAIEQNLQNAGLPATVNPQVTALNINSSPVIIASIAATSEDGLTEAARVAQEDIKPALLAIDGVGSVDITGGEEQRVLVTLDPDKLAANGVSISQITGVLAANNLTFPSGEITTDTSKISVSTIGRIESVDAVKNLVVGVSTPQAAPVDPTASADPAASPVAPRQACRPDAGHDRRPRHGRDPGRRDDRLRPDERAARALAVRLQDLGCEHGQRRRRGHRSRPAISVFCVITEWNTGRLKDFADFFARYPLAKLGFMHPNFTPDYVAQQHNARYGTSYPATESNVACTNFAKTDLDELWQQMLQIRRAEYPFPISFSPEIHRRQDLDAFYHRPETLVGKRCIDVFRNMMIKSDGTVIPSHGRCYNYPVGNVYKSELSAIWNHRRSHDIRRDLKTAGGLFPACSRCCSAFGG